MTVRTSDFRPLTSDRGSTGAICVLLFISITAIPIMNTKSLILLLTGMTLALLAFWRGDDAFTPVPASAAPSVLEDTRCRQLIQNPDFVNGYEGWTQNLYLTARYQDELGETHEGAWFGGAQYVDQFLYQDVAIPADSPTARLSFLWAMDPSESIGPGEALTITLRQPDDTLLRTLMVIDEHSMPRQWQTASFDLSSFVGQTVRIHAQAVTTSSTTSWYLDQVRLIDCEWEYAVYLPRITR